MKTHFYLVASLVKPSEGGGFSQKEVKAIAKSHGLECQAATDWSPLMGHFGVALKTEDKRRIGKFLGAVGL
jgi:hypothetical protein